MYYRRALELTSADHKVDPSSDLNKETNDSNIKGNLSVSLVHFERAPIKVAN